MSALSWGPLQLGALGTCLGCPFCCGVSESMSTFIWNKTIPRIRRAHLEKQKEAGGLALPNFLQYYWAANIYKLIYWVSASYEGDGPVWVEMELHSAHPVSLPSLICAPLPVSKQRLTNNPIVSGSLRIRSQFKTHLKHRQALPSLPISANALFPPSLMDTAFKLRRIFLRMVCSCHSSSW